MDLNQTKKCLKTCLKFRAITEYVIRLHANPFILPEPLCAFIICYICCWSRDHDCV